MYYNMVVKIIFYLKQKITNCDLQSIRTHSTQIKFKFQTNKSLFKEYQLSQKLQLLYWSV